MKNVLIFGASGFLGQSLIPLLLDSGYQVTGITRSIDREKNDIFSSQVNWVVADLYQTDQWRQLVTDHKIIVNLVGTIREDPSKGLTYQHVIVDAAKAIADSIPNKPDYHLLFVSTNLDATSTPENYRESKQQAENYLLTKDFQTTILRPSMMYGSNKPATLEASEKILAHLSPDNPNWKNRPIAVEKVAQTIKQAIENPELAQPIYYNYDMV